MTERLFRDRRDAGRTLARLLDRYRGQPDVVVLGPPRGGVPVAYEVARELEAPLDVLVVRKAGRCPPPPSRRSPTSNRSAASNATMSSADSSTNTVTRHKNQQPPARPPTGLTKCTRSRRPTRTTHDPNRPCQHSDHQHAAP